MEFTPTDDTFAGHGKKSLTVETTPAGVTYLYVTAGNTRVMLMLTTSEAFELSDALRSPGITTEITNY